MRPAEGIRLSIAGFDLHVSGERLDGHATFFPATNSRRCPGPPRQLETDVEGNRKNR